MHELEQIIVLFVAAVLLAAAARKLGAPSPVFLALGGAALALVPGAPELTLPPDLVLALFVAPILVDAGYDASLRDLKDNWLPLTSLVVVAVGLTTAAVALVVHTLVPSLPWAAAVALGAIVAPPDAVAATAVLRPLHPPQRILGVLEGESLLNDASALLIYRLAVGAVASGGFVIQAVAPAFVLSVVGSLIAGPVLGFLTQRLLERVQHIPTAILLQFVGTIAVWQLSERFGLSGVLTTVGFAMTLARLAPARIGARVRVPTNAVWATVVFALNLLAFIFIGLQLRPILIELPQTTRDQYLSVAAAVLATVIAVRIVWHMTFNQLLQFLGGRHSLRAARLMLRPTVGSGLVISWAGMRGVVTLAAALALPATFPGRDLILLTAFLVVLGTLLIQGLTLKPLLRGLKLRDNDPVGEEETAARQRMLEAALARIPAEKSAALDLARKNLKMHLGRPLHAPESAAASFGVDYDTAYEGALSAARQTLLDMRDAAEIGDDAFHALENELDWLEATDPLRAANADAIP
ncbi:sodium:proton antiporter [Mitsuaria sp. CC2]|uniref:cation:proton antiporter n=1 Tax=Mitsuaria sp. CC2 TaxID=3029186 RepID=UPI003B8D966C